MDLALLILFSTLFAVTHIGMSHDPFRSKMIARLGEKPFMGIYSLVSFITFGGAIWLFAGNRKAGPELWAFSPWLLPVIYILMLAAFMLFVLSMATPSPAGMRPAAMKPRGVLRITRHPMFMAFACFGLAHMIANGSLGDLFFFGSLFVVGFFGAYHQDKRKVREKGRDFETFQEQTSILPFAAAIQGKTRLEWAELSKVFLFVAGAAYVVIIFLHQRLFGISPF